MSTSRRTDPDALDPLKTYGISRRTGFVPESDPLPQLPEALRDWDVVVGDLAALIRSRRVRGVIAALAPFDFAEIAGEPAQERALLVLTMLANAWVWGDDTPARSIPQRLAMPLHALADRMGRPPLVHYASMVLNNWRRIDPTGPIAVDNIAARLGFLGGVDEDWFLVSSIGVELAGAPLLARIHASVERSRTVGDAELTVDVEGLAAAMADVNAALERVYDWCDPLVFFKRVRPYLAGWHESGVVYEGVAHEPRRFVGGSAGQSSLIQALDVALRVEHAPAGARSYLAGLRDYMPPRHRRFIADVEATSRIADRARDGSTTLGHAYNAVVHQLGQFRQFHLGISRDYIETPAGKLEGALGTGGTQARDFLASLQRSTDNMRVG